MKGRAVSTQTAKGEEIRTRVCKRCEGSGNGFGNRKYGSEINDRLDSRRETRRQTKGVPLS